MLRLKNIVLFACIVSATITAANAQSTVFIPGNTLGGFGNPSVNGNQPYVGAVTATGPGAIEIAYLSGTVTDDPGINTGPDGAKCGNCFPSQQDPLDEARGVVNENGFVSNVDGLIGIFVEQSRVLAPGFSPLDGTKNLVHVGLLPSDLFFVGAFKTLPVKTAGTLFLGINDSNGTGNGGGFTVAVSFIRAE